MPRIARGLLAGQAYHILNRGNGQAIVFHKDSDYRAFIDLLGSAKARYPVRLFAFCVMPNHFHLVLQPETPSALSPFMQWWLTSHVRRYHQHYGGSGHIWQGRFKSFPIQEDEHLFTVLRYVLWNPVRAGLVRQVQEWPWTSLHAPGLVDPWPIPLSADRLRWLGEPLTQPELEALRRCVTRQAPYGSTEWQVTIAAQAGLESTLRPRGRPRKQPKSSLSP